MFQIQTQASRTISITVLVLTILLLTSCGGVGSSRADGGNLSSTPVVPVTFPVGTLQLRGVNLAGADFGEGRLPGTFGIDYTYPTSSEVLYFKNKGMNFVRLPFRWERLQPELNQPFDSAELARLQNTVAEITNAGLTVLLDPHNYARYQGQLIGSAQVPHAAFADFWRRLATLYKSNPLVMFGLMNEPNTMPTETWVAAANVAIVAVRSAGASNFISVPGNGWTGAHSWTQNWYGTSNAVAMLLISDPINNLVFEAHQYLDVDSSGRSAICVSSTIGAERLAVFTNWLRTNRKRGLLGEFAGADNPTCNQAVSGMLDFMQSNADVWVGWSWWAAGPWWGNYIYSIEPSNGEDRPQMRLLTPYLQ